MGSTSAWVPITVGLIGLLGVLATQLIANRRARVEHEAAERREQRRWDRELEATHAAQDREDKYRLHQEKQQAYARLTHELLRWWDVLGSMRASRATGSAPTQEDSAAATSLEHSVEEASALVMLLAPKAIRGCYRTLWAHLVLTQDKARWREGSIEEIDEDYNKAFGHYMRMLDYLRIDLGVEPEHPENQEKFNRAN